MSKKSLEQLLKEWTNLKTNLKSRARKLKKEYEVLRKQNEYLSKVNWLSVLIGLGMIYWLVRE